ncbi:glycosyltransferase family protein [Belnapia moabensis]|uniref:glycosyltransferase n=1 Tax=Belnapia moabensis TaxID=365533 RepID=UPI0012ECE757|nr:glycosyltransferase [Belnapia moabensis]
MREAFDIVVAHIGDHAGFHGALPAAMQRVDMVGVFHDAFIANLAFGCLDGDAAALRAVLRQSYGEDSWPVGQTFLHDTADVARRRPMLEWLAQRTIGAVAHAKHYAARLGRVCLGPTAVIPLAFTVPDLPPSPAPWNRITIGVVGHANPNKRIDQLILAIGASPYLRSCCRIRVIGEASDDMRARLNQLAQTARILPLEITGWVTDDELRWQLRDVDIMSCLRNPVLEGASASLILALRSGRPTLVTWHGSYAEVPPHLVLGCSPEREAYDVMRHLENFHRAPALLLAMGRQAQDFAESHYSPATYSQALVSLLHKALSNRPRSAAKRRLTTTLTGFGLALEDAAVTRAHTALDELLSREGRIVS